MASDGRKRRETIEEGRDRKERNSFDENASLFGDKGGVYTFSLAGRKRFAFE